jgi:predicted kinase
VWNLGKLPAVLVAGPPASGKTVLGAALARSLNAVLFDQDVLTKPLTAVVAGLLGTDDLDDPRLALSTRAARYETLFDAAADNLAIGNPVVLVAPFTAERRDPVALSQVADRFAALAAKATLVWLRATPDLLRDRMGGRAAARDRAKLADLAAFLDRVDFAPPAVPHLAVSAAAAPADQVRLVLEQLDVLCGPSQ